MDYSTFKSRWQSALSEARMLSYPELAEETIDLRHMDRRYQVFARCPDPLSPEPFHVSCRLSWRWDALHSARSSTTEEDMLTELTGRDQISDMRTERSWLRVDVKLFASLSMGEGQRMPAKATWKRFVTAVARKIDPLFPLHQVDPNDDSAVLGWCGQPTANVLCEVGGQVQLAGVELEAYQPVFLPRQWDDPAREPDPQPDEELLAFAERTREAMQQWAEAVKVLRIVDVSAS